MEEPNIPLTEMEEPRRVKLRKDNVDPTQATSMTDKEKRLPTLLFPNNDSDDPIRVKCRNERDEKNAQSKRDTAEPNRATLRREREAPKLGTAKTDNAAPKRNRLVHENAAPNL